MHSRKNNKTYKAMTKNVKKQQHNFTIAVSKLNYTQRNVGSTKLFSHRRKRYYRCTEMTKIQEIQALTKFIFSEILTTDFRRN